MRIGLFSDTYTPEINGVVTSIVTLQNELEKQGNTVFVITTNNSSLHIQKDGNILRMPGIEIKKLYGYRMSSPFSVVGLNDIREMKLDIIHVHTEFGIGTFARIVAKLLSIPIVATYHTMYEDYTHYLNIIQSQTLDGVLKNIAGGWSRIYGELCSELIAPSAKTKNVLEGYGVKNNIHVIPTGLPLERFDALNFSEKAIKELKGELQLKDDEKMLLYVGRIAEEKSIDVVLRAVKIIKEKHLKIKCVIVGGGPGLVDLKKMATDLAIEEYIIFTDKKPAIEVPLYYHISDMFVSASLTETQGLTFIEAMASSNCVFAAEKELLTDLVYEGTTGFYFDDEFSLVSKIETYLNMDIQKQKELKNKALSVVKPYDARIFGQRVKDVYISAITSHKDLYVLENVKVKKTNYYELTLKNELETLKCMVYIDTYYTNHLEKGCLVERNLIEVFKQESAWIEAYDNSIRYLTSKDRTRKEMYDYLTNNFSLPISEVNKIIEKFEELNYINDDRYMHQQIEMMHIMLFGKKKILSTLVKKGIPYDKIEAVLEENDNTSERESAIKVIEKTLPLLKSKNTSSTKASLQTKLTRSGYSFDIINEALALIDFSKDDENELNILRKEYLKLSNHLARKYVGKELKNKLLTTLIRKGYDYDQVIRVMEEKDEND